MFKYDGVTLFGEKWGDGERDYEAECANNEKRVVVRNDEDRRAIIMQGQMIFSKSRKNGGRILMRHVAVNGVQLRKYDRLEPSPDLHDVGQLEEATLPITVIFWRTLKDGRGRIIDGLSRRCPLFGPELGITPRSVMMVDILHTLYLGVYQRYVCAVLWRCLQDNVFGIRGNDAVEIHNMGVSRLWADLRLWYENNAVDKDTRLATLTPAMLGTRKKNHTENKSCRNWRDCGLGAKLS